MNEKQDQAKPIDETVNWIHRVIIGCNFCPFAARPMQDNRVHFRLVQETELENMLTALGEEFEQLDAGPEMETTLIIYPNALTEFEEYLDFLGMCQQLLKDLNYEGIYQLASFHPEYRFAGTEADDPSNYTNRSPYPTIHIIREKSIDKALASYPNPEEIPERNIRFAREKGLAYMKSLFA